MKQRLLVMNGQRIVQAEQEGAWANQKVDKAGALKPEQRQGILCGNVADLYKIDLATLQAA